MNQPANTIFDDSTHSAAASAASRPLSIDHTPQLQIETNSLARVGIADNNRAPMVLHVRVVHGSGGGPDKTILRSAKYVPSHRYRVAAVYLHPHDDPGMQTIRTHAREQDCPLYEIGETGPLDPRAIRDLTRLCRKLRVDVWHAHDYKSDALGLLLKRFWPMKLVTTVHGWTRESLRTKVYYHIDNFCLRRYQQVMTVSSPLTDHCRKLGVPENRLTYIPNGIEIDQFTPSLTKEQARRDLGIAQNHFILGVVSRLSIEKGVDRAIQTLAQLTRQQPTLQLHLIGDGPEHQHLLAQAKSLNIENQVIFHGWQADARPFYQAMDGLLLPSRTEGLPNVVLEAMAMNVPVAATDVGGVRDLLDQGRCGIVLPGLTDTWPNLLQSWITNPTLRQTHAQIARQRVQTQFSFAGRVEKELQVYDLVLGRNTADRSNLAQAA